MRLHSVCSAQSNTGDDMLVHMSACMYNFWNYLTYFDEILVLEVCTKNYWINLYCLD